MKYFELGEELAEVAKRLIYIKKSMAALQEEEKIIKKKLEPQIRVAEPLMMSDGKIYFYSEKIAKTFKRSDVLKFVEEHFGPEIALTLDIKCTRKKLIAKRLHVKTWENK